MYWLKQYVYYVLITTTLLAAIWHTDAHAHKPSDSYLNLSLQQQLEQKPANTAQAQWDIALRDIDYAIGLDTDGNSEITWQEVVTRQAEIFAYALARLAVKSQQTACDLTPSNLLIDHHTDGAYAVIQFKIACKQAITRLSVDYHLFADIDPSHRGLLKLDYWDNNNANKANSPQKITKTAIFSPDSFNQTFTLSSPNRFAEFKQYVIEGVWHIWIGFDHILFLIALLLPAVFIYSGRNWQPSQQFKTTFLDVLKVVTAFTLAHSITLTLATLQIVELPSRWVEAAIAASVVVAALNNLWPYLIPRRWLAAFVFGLIHGFGFAAVLADLGLQQGTLVIALIGFNIGVEIGQLAILSLFVPIAYLLRNTWFYKNVIFYGGSIIIVGIALAWFTERAFNLTIFSSVFNLLGFS